MTNVMRPRLAENGTNGESSPSGGPTAVVFQGANVAFHIYPGNSPVKYLVYDDDLNLLTVLFDNPYGLGTFNGTFKVFGLVDANVPKDSAEHVAYHERIERQILSQFQVDLSGKTVADSHGHFPLSEDAEVRGGIAFQLGQYKMVDKNAKKAMVTQFYA